MGHDPCGHREAEGLRLSVELTEQTIRAHDCVLIVTDHDAIDYELLGRTASLIVDTRNAMARVKNPAATIVKA